MARFLVSYDLVKRKDYPKLIEELERMGGAKPLLSAWFVERNTNAGDLRDHLAQFVDKDDRLVVIEFTKRPRWTMMLNPGADWVNARAWPN